MAHLLIRRILIGLLILWAVSVVIFAGTEILPGDLPSAILQNNATPEAVAELRKELGLDRPPLVRYGEWIGDILTGDFGRSLVSKRELTDEIVFRAYNTFFLAGYAAIVSMPIAVFLGLVASIWPQSILDRTLNVVWLTFLSLPSYFLAYLLVYYFSVKMPWFPSLATVSPSAPISTRLYVMFLPMLTLALLNIGNVLRLTRTIILQIMRSPYIEMAFLKGLPRWRVVLEHALPNAIGVIANVVALNLAYLVVGVVVIEVVFVYPGLGQLMVDAVAKHDVPTVQACGLIFAATFVTLNLIADVLTLVSNPRLLWPR
jgi:peptide/nickel transport system permease protein